MRTTAFLCVAVIQLRLSLDSDTIRHRKNPSSPARNNNSEKNEPTKRTNIKTQRKIEMAEAKKKDTSTIQVRYKHNTRWGGPK